MIMKRNVIDPLSERENKQYLLANQRKILSKIPKPKPKLIHVLCLFVLCRFFFLLLSVLFGQHDAQWSAPLNRAANQPPTAKKMATNQ